MKQEFLEHANEEQGHAEEIQASEEQHADDLVGAARESTEADEHLGVSARSTSRSSFFGIVGRDRMVKYTLPELPYDYSALEPHYSAKLLALHHDKHHAGYVTGANTTLEKLSEARAEGDFAAINQLQKSLAFHLSGHVLHSLLWKNLSPRGGGEPDGELAAAVNEFFGSFKGLNRQLTEAAMNIQGSGWGALGWEPLGRRLVVEQVYDHQGNIGNGTVPLLVLDMWEHAYYLQHENVKGDWVKAFWKLVDWSDVAKRFSSVRTLDLAL